MYSATQKTKIKKVILEPLNRMGKKHYKREERKKVEKKEDENGLSFYTM
jgi:hypothetical protein